MYLYLIRHGRTVWNEEGKIQGNIDTQLNEVGIEQAELLGQRLAYYPISHIYTSDLQRAAGTAQIINRYLRAKVVFEKGLREISYGEWEGKNWDEINNNYADYLKKWRQDRINIPAPGGESVLDLEKRLKLVIAEINNLNTEHLAIVTHSGVLKTLICIFLKITLDKQACFSFKNCGISILKLNPDQNTIQVICLNDFSHLDSINDNS